MRRPLTMPLTLLLASVSLSLGYHGAALPRIITRPRTPSARLSDAQLDQYLSVSSVSEAVALLKDEALQPSREQTSSLLDAACASMSALPAPPGADVPSENGGPPTRRGAPAGGAASVASYEQQQQDELKAVYDALAARGALRGYGTVATTALLPVSNVREITSEEQLRLTGLPTAAFAPPKSSSASDVIAGGVCALLLSAISYQFDLNLQFVIGAAVAAAVADRLLLSGAALETATRIVKPGYAQTVREHEAGHFLAACTRKHPLTSLRCLPDLLPSRNSPMSALRVPAFARRSAWPANRGVRARCVVGGAGWARVWCGGDGLLRSDPRQLNADRQDHAREHRPLLGGRDGGNRRRGFELRPS